MRSCARCGLKDEEKNLLDLDTGSICHPELIHCIKALQNHHEKLLTRMREFTCDNCYNKFRSDLA